jgi:hypothetical protein
MQTAVRRRSHATVPVISSMPQFIFTVVLGSLIQLTLL